MTTGPLGVSFHGSTSLAFIGRRRGKERAGGFFHTVLEAVFLDWRCFAVAAGRTASAATSSVDW